MPTATLHSVVELQGEARNLIPEDWTYAQWRDYAYHAWSRVSHDAGLEGFHDLRTAYACERYELLTGYPAPVVAGAKTADKENDIAARVIIATELGHGRVDVVSAYVGSAR